MNKIFTAAAVTAILGGGLLAPGAAAQELRGFYMATPGQIERTLRRVSSENLNLPDRIGLVSSYFLGIPYVLGPLGEGPAGHFDRNPIVSFKGLDCTTMVEEVMAFSLEPDLDKGVRLLQKIRYKNGVVSYRTRNHFPSVDWIPNNIAAGFIRDITRNVAGDQTLIASKLISKRSWYAAKTAADLRGFDNLSPDQAAELTEQWRAGGESMPDVTASLPYLPIGLLPRFIDDIPSGTIVNLVRADDPSKPVMVSHQLLLIDSGGGKIVREAAYGDKVKDIPALDYFKIYRNSKWPLLGLNLDEILPRSQ
ncbi:MAG: N-acetylmuramoyl-L-alanine amidase-like domain-containing protein [Elusimicrobiota bacterium]